MKKLIANSAHLFNRVLAIPFAGDVQVSATGEIEVQDDIAQSIVDADCGFDYPDTFQKVEVDNLGAQQGNNLQDSTTTTTIVEPTTTTTTTEEVQETTTTTTVAEVTNEQLAEELDKTHTLAQLKEIATEEQYPAAEWRNLNKAELIQYIIAAQSK